MERLVFKFCKKLSKKWYILKGTLYSVLVAHKEWIENQNLERLAASFCHLVAALVQVYLNFMYQTCNNLKINLKKGVCCKVHCYIIITIIIIINVMARDKHSSLLYPFISD